MNHLDKILRHIYLLFCAIVSKNCSCFSKHSLKCSRCIFGILQRLVDTILSAVGITNTKLPSSFFAFTGGATSSNKGLGLETGFASAVKL